MSRTLFRVVTASALVTGLLWWAPSYQPPSPNTVELGPMLMGYETLVLIGALVASIVGLVLVLRRVLRANDRGAA
jgi:hypothetical protein